MNNIIMNNIRMISCFLLLGFLLTAITVDANETDTELYSDLMKLSVEELMEVEVATVYGASKYEQKVTEAPSSVSIVTAAEIKKYGYRTLADILRSIRGFFITYDRNYSYVGVRGFNRPGDYNTRILLLIDGHRINDAIYDQATIESEFILDVDLIDRVEVIRGPSSSLYGSNAFFAVINIITKKGRDFNGMETSGEAASFNTFKGRLSYGNKFKNDLEVVFSGTVFDRKGRDLFFREFDDFATNNGIAEKKDGNKFHSFFSTVSYKDITLQTAYISREKKIPTASFGTVFNDPRNRTIDEQYYADLKYERNLDPQTSIMVRIFYNWYKYQGYYVYQDNTVNPISPFLYINNDSSICERWGAEFKVTRRMFEKHKVTIGIEYQDNFRQDQKNFNEDPFSQILDDKRSTQKLGIYLQDEFEILKNLILNAGMRYDHYQTSGGTTNPRIALIYNPYEKTTVKLLYGRAFRDPNAYEQFYNDGEITTKNSPNLRLETINTYEAVLEQYIGNCLRLVATGYYYKINNLITQQTDPIDGLLIYKNIEEIKARGLELELEGKWASGLEGRISYAFQETKNILTNDILTNSPKHLAKVNLIIPLIKKKLFAGIEEQYTSKRKTLAGNYAAGFFITNLTLFSQNLLKKLEVSGSVYNLFDKKYGDPGSEEHLQDIIQQDGRSFRFKLTYKF